MYHSEAIHRLGKKYHFDLQRRRRRSIIQKNMAARAPENTLGLVTSNQAVIEVFLRKYEVGQEVPPSDFETDRNRFYQNVCVGLLCPALKNKTCFGPRRGVEIHDAKKGTIILAQAELNTPTPITADTIDSLKCNPEVTNLI